jgi:hypothetical protein
MLGTARKCTALVDCTVLRALLYRSRVEQMRRSMNVGVIAAIFLIATLISVISGKLPVFKYVSACSAVVGLFLVAAAATYVLRENSSIKQVMEEEPEDQPELRSPLRNRPGA